MSGPGTLRLSELDNDPRLVSFSRYAEKVADEFQQNPHVTTLLERMAQSAGEYL
jgi:hypothetical protein